MPDKDRSKSRRVERSGRVPSGTRPSRLDRERFFALLAAGMSNQQACVEVGINARTGRDWRRGVRKTSKGARVYPDRPVVVAADFGAGKAISARYLSEDDRVVIADLHRAGQGVRMIAAAIGRAPSTISRELRRNAHPFSDDYRPHAAQRRAAARRPRPKLSKLAASPALRTTVQDCVSRLKWSPEQISAHLSVQHPDDPSMNVSHETIYQALYLQGRGELRRELSRCLRTGRAVRKPSRQAGQRPGSSTRW